MPAQLGEEQPQGVPGVPRGPAEVQLGRGEVQAGQAGLSEEDGDQAAADRGPRIGARLFAA